MRNFIVTILCLCSSATAFANFQGVWKGTGTMTDQSGKPINCEELELMLLQDSESITVNSGNFKCGSMNRSWPTVRFRIGFGELYFKDKRIGKFSGNSIVASLTHPTNGQVILIQAAENATTLVYRESWSQPNQQPHQIINGIFKRHNLY